MCVHQAGIPKSLPGHLTDWPSHFSTKGCGHPSLCRRTSAHLGTGGLGFGLSLGFVSSYLICGSLAERSYTPSGPQFNKVNMGRDGGPQSPPQDNCKV